MSRVTKSVIAILLLTAAMVGGAAYWVHFVFLPGALPMINHDHTQALVHRLSQVSSADFQAAGVAVPSSPTELPPDQVRRLIKQLAASGRFPDWKPDAKLMDLYGRPYLFSVRRSNASDGHWSSSDGTSGPKEFIFEVSVVNEAGAREVFGR